MEHFAFVVDVYNEFEPRNVTEALKSANRDKWQLAMNGEIDAHKENNT